MSKRKLSKTQCSIFFSDTFLDPKGPWIARESVPKRKRAAAEARTLHILLSALEVVLSFILATHMSL